MGSNLKRNLDKKKKEEYILQFQKQYNISDLQLLGVCKIFKTNNSINGRVNAINLWLYKAMLEMQKDKNGECKEKSDTIK